MLKFITPLSAIILVGCAQPARIGKMSVDTISPNNISFSQKLKNNISVSDVSGGKKTHPLWASNVSSEDFQKALEASLKTNGLFSLENDTYKLNAELLALQQPFMGLNMTVISNVNYEIFDVKTKTKIFSKIITGSHTATFSDAPLGTARLQIANEGAIQNNIHQFLTELSKINLS